MKKVNSRWGSRGQRYSSDRTVEDSRQVRDRRGVKRLKRDAPSEVQWCERRREAFGWRNGARLRPAA
jgi:hypothetical protein